MDTKHIVPVISTAKQDMYSIHLEVKDPKYVSDVGPRLTDVNLNSS